MDRVQRPDQQISDNEKLFNLYLRELIEWNKKFNLTAITDPEEIKVRHFEDSLSILQAIDLQDQKVVDIGPGAGFPGIPLKIVRPGISLTLIEGTRKKADFLNHIVQTLNLPGVEVIWGRAEEIAKKAKYHEKFDVATARAVAKLPDLLKYSMRLLHPKGILIAQKQNEIEAELELVRPELEAYHASIVEVKKVEVGGVIRSLVVIKKN